MDLTEKRKILKEYQRTQKTIDLLTERIARLKSTAEKVTSVFSDTYTAGGGGLPDKVQAYAENVEELKNQLADAIDRLREQDARIFRAMEKLRPYDQALIQEYYFEGMLIWEMAQKHHYSERRIIQLINAALERMDL